MEYGSGFTIRRYNGPRPDWRGKHVVVSDFFYVFDDGSARDGTVSDACWKEWWEPGDWLFDSVEEAELALAKYMLLSNGLVEV